MFWGNLLARIWPYIAFAVAGALVLYGAYSHGRKVERAEWVPRVAAAEKALIKAETEAATKASLARELTTLSDARYADTILRLNERAVDVSRDMRTLSLRIATILARNSQMSTVPGAPGTVDATTAIEERANGAADRFTRVGTGCELDAAQVEALQRYLIDLRTLWSSKPSLDVGAN